MVAASGAQALPLGDRLAAGAEVGSTGVGIESLFNVNRTLVVRGAIEGFAAGRDVRSGALQYRGRGRWITDSGLLVLHPFRSPLLASVGAYYGWRDIRLDATPSGPVAAAGRILSAADLGRVHGKARLSSFAPFVGVGWDTTFHGARRWGFKARVGAVFSDRPSVKLRADGAAAADAAVQAYLRAEEAAVAHKLRGLRTWPVVQVGLNRRF
jgi:hypothetical protein